MAKDKGGHGSEKRGAGRRFTTLAGNVVLGKKDPITMTNAELAKEFERVTLHASAVGREFINAGRSMERPTDRVALQDPLSVKDRALNTRASALHDEAEYRNRMGGRRVATEDGRVKFVGKQPGSLRRGYFSGDGS